MPTVLYIFFMNNYGANGASYWLHMSYGKCPRKKPEMNENKNVDTEAAARPLEIIQIHAEIIFASELRRGCSLSFD